MFGIFLTLGEDGPSRHFHIRTNHIFEIKKTWLAFVSAKELLKLLNRTSNIPQFLFANSIVLSCAIKKIGQRKESNSTKNAKKWVSHVASYMNLGKLEKVQKLTNSPFLRK